MSYPQSAALEQARAREALRDYFNLTKPRVNLLVLVTAACSMWIAPGGPPPFGIALATLLGTAFAGGAAGALNCYFDRDIDALMPRTSGRPLPAGRVEPAHALTFALTLALVSFLLLSAWVNVLTAAIAMAGIFYYAVVYTLWLKRRTPQNIVIGGAAGCVGPLIGWAAVTGTLDVTAWLLFAVIFFWTPPHFWALALYCKEDYAAAGVPMLPVVAGDEETKRQILIYSVVLLLTTGCLYLAGPMGIAYLASSTALGAVLVRLAYRLLRGGTEQASRGLFAYSILYLFALFAVMVIDVRLFP